MEIIKLEKEFVKKQLDGHKHPVRFIQLEETDNAYLYKREIDAHVDYEVFIKRYKNKRALIDGELKNTGDKREIYPKTEEFGKFAWAFMKKDKAYMKLKELNPVSLI